MPVLSNSVIIASYALAEVADQKHRGSRSVPAARSTFFAGVQNRGFCITGCAPYRQKSSFT
jgi:hypothetical protein